MDVTKDYHNLLTKEVNGVIQQFVWDSHVLQSDTKGEYSFYFQDDLGSPTGIYGNQGAIEQEYIYDVFGKEQGKATGTFGFTGYQRDEVSNLYFAQARYYQPGNGRFVSRDFDKYMRKYQTKTLNQYVYCQSNPLLFIDPTGNDPDEIGNQLYLKFDKKELENQTNMYGYTMDGLEIANESTSYWMIKSIQKESRPANIGKGSWAKVVASDMDDVGRVSGNFSKALNKLGWFSVVIDVGSGVNSNVKKNASKKKLVSDAGVDIAISGGTVAASGAAAGGIAALFSGAAAGGAAGTVVPGVGNVVGAVGGAVVGGLTYVATDVIKIKGKSLRQRIKDKVSSLFGD